jgi:hypothetical protein
MAKISLHSFRNLLLVLAFTSFANGSFAQTLPVPGHVVVLFLENYAYAQIIGSQGSPYAPHINNFVGDPNAAIFTQFYAIEHPSQPNYLDFLSGQNQGVTDDNVPASYPFTTDNLAAELLSASKTFITYSEDLPSVGYDGASYTAGSANYARKHNPVANWIGTSTNQVPASLNQPFTAFPGASNYSTLPTVSIVVPNMTNDMHDGTWPSNITLGDTWTYNNLNSLKQWSLANNTLYILIFDEDDDLHNNNIPTIFYGPMVRGGNYSENISFYNLLRTIEDMYHLGHAGNAATATDITDCWQTVSTGLNNVENKNNSFSVVPNPASDYLNFTSSNPINTAVNISVTDESGRLAGTYTMTGAELKVNTSAFAAGVYFYKIANNNGQVVAEGKFIIAHN